MEAKGGGFGVVDGTRDGDETELESEGRARKEKKN